MRRHKRIYIVVSVILIMMVALSQCIDPGKESAAAGYIGAESCYNCHKSISDTYAHTAHNKSSAPASKETVRGSFDPKANTYVYRPGVKVVMEARDSGLYQVAYSNNIERQANRFDITIGSGRKAQTYLYWFENKTYQLPVSYFVPADSWVNSPGYPPHQVRFDRNVPIGCFECHSSYIRVVSNEVVKDRIIDNFDKNTIRYGINCERCHGPAGQHVSFHEKHPQEKAPKYIAVYSSLTRQQKIDMCAVCHSGMQQTLRSTFQFKPGDTLMNSFFAKAAPVIVSELDVHGNQTQLLTASACFLKSKTLTCSSCHNTHVTERDNIALFSRRCMNCHNNPVHRFDTTAKGLATAMINNCIDCHMPEKPSSLITLLSNGQPSPQPDLVRTHLVTIYPEATRKFISSVKK